MAEILIQISGWAGTVLIVGAYLMVSIKKLDPIGKAYQLLNLIGSIGVGINVFHNKAWPALTLEIVWSAIAIYALTRFSKK